MGIYQGNDLKRTSSGSTRTQSSRLAEPLWTDPGFKKKSGIGVRELICTCILPPPPIFFFFFNQAQAGNEPSNLPPRFSQARKKPSPPLRKWVYSSQPYHDSTLSLSLDLSSKPASSSLRSSSLSGPCCGRQPGYYPFSSRFDKLNLWLVLGATHLSRSGSGVSRISFRKKQTWCKFRRRGGFVFFFFFFFFVSTAS